MKYTQALSGKVTDNDDLLRTQLNVLLNAFKFYYGSFELEKAV